MLKSKNKFILGFLLLAAVSFICLSIGGEFLHSQIHAHNSQASQDQCPLSQFLTQIFLAALFTWLAVGIKTIQKLFTLSFRLVDQLAEFFCCSRAPPAVLS